MGKLYELVKKEIEEIEKQATLEKSNFIKSKSFNNVNKDNKNIRIVNGLIDIINRQAPELFGSREAFKEFLKDNDELFVKKAVFKNDYVTTIPTISKMNPLHYTGNISDYETIFDKLEEKLGESKIKEIIDAYDKDACIKNPVLTYPMEPYVNDIKKDVDTLFNEADDNTKDELKQNLDYVSKMLVEKKNRGQYDDVIDDVSCSRAYTAKNNIEEYAIQKGIDSDKLVSLQTENSLIDVVCNTNDDVKFTKGLALNNEENKISPKFKEKLIDLDRFITEQGVPTVFITGEQGTKEYGFYDYYKKSEEISNLIGTYQEVTTDDQKKNIINEINVKANELSLIETKYDAIFRKIERTFDLDKISLNANLYTGREASFVPENLKTFRPNLQPKWDNENSPWGVILSGFCQIKGAAARAGMSFEEYLDKPVEAFLKIADNHSKYMFDQVYMTRGEDSPTGKRLAHCLVMDRDMGQKYQYDVSLEGRAIEFLNTAEDFDDNTIGKVINNNIGFNYFRQFNRSPDKMWMKGEEPDYDSIKNVFAMAEKTDRLYELSNNNYDVNLNMGSKYSYKDVVTTELNNHSGLEEKNNVLCVFKDYMLERNVMMSNPMEYVQVAKGDLQAYLDDIAVLVAGKKYYDDFLIMNNKDIYSYNKNDRKEIVNFLKDPVGAFAKKYKKEYDLDNNFINTLKENYKEENDRINGAPKLEAFRTAFNKYNTYEGNRGKNFNQLLKDNAGGWLEWLGRTTSRQYLDLKEAFEAANDPQSATFGDFKSSKYFAQKYIEHKLPEGVSFENLKPNEKRRVEFCRSIIAAVDEIEKTNPDLENQNNNAIDNNIIDDNFHEELNKDVNINKENINENIIDITSNANVENKEIEHNS